MVPPLQRYLAYAFERSTRVDFLSVLDEDIPAERLAAIAARQHSVWETDIWIHVAGRKLVHCQGTGYRILPAASVKAEDRIISSERVPCTVSVRDDGQFSFTPTDQPTPYKIFTAPDPEEHQKALRDAMPAMYAEFMKERSTFA